jgi:Kef-type K+ transport system membrane component KefB
MSPTELFVVLVALAFIGGVRAARGSSSIWGLSSGVEYVALGAVLGPEFLGVVTRGAVEGFEALLLMGLGWLFAVHGANFGRAAWGRFDIKHNIPGFLSSVLCGAALFFGTYYLARHFHLRHPGTLALGLAAVCTESSFAPAAQQEAASEPRRDDANKWQFGTELVPILLVGAMVVSAALPSFRLPPPLFQELVSVVLGFLLGGIVTALIGAHFERSELWPLLLGAVLLVIGTALRVDLPAATPAFILGLTVSSLSRHSDEVRRLMASTERPLLLPCLLLAGVLLRFPVGLERWAVVLAALFIRTFLKAIFGWIAHIGTEVPLGAATRSLQRSSAFSIALGLVIFLRLTDEVGRSILTASVLGVLMGDLIGYRPKRGENGASEDAGASELSVSALSAEEGALSDSGKAT